ncbi:hypothetical protein JAAARDRAFT_41315 [Jaapia argillacea MUCL 33604]|uniref:Uncharacterized protein n=1 Tax=Jaapia argillacea MUCL 33604 TaxID=933084 RepID=A0A067PLB7_9AGAM|nr:hypothetical protein JAAARDRAFT_41315 [Jaapia argillacea MUCL 33604]
MPPKLPNPCTSLASLLTHPSSMTHRTQITSLVSSLKRTRPRVPFRDLKAHRIPTLWVLYRGLLKEASSDDIRFRVRMLFRKNRYLTNPFVTREKLLQGHKWLDMFKRANEGDEQAKRVLARYSNVIAAKRDKERWKQIIRDEVAWQHRLRNRPILTGSYLRPSLFNRPLPRLKPQPLAISGMMHKRREARMKRNEKIDRVNGLRDDVRAERQFEEGLVNEGSRIKMDFAVNWKSWMSGLSEYHGLLAASFVLDTARLNTPYPPALLAQIKAARTEKIRNKTHEHNLALAGYRSDITLGKQRSRPPIQVWEKMSEKERKDDRVVRGVGFSGYVGAVKRMRGWKWKGKGEEMGRRAFVAERGKEWERKRLVRDDMEVREENRRRREAAREVTSGDEV